jgi:recombination protein RecT
MTVSNIRTAVARADEARGTSDEKPVSPAALVRQAIETQSDAFRQVLPSVIDPDRFSRLVLTACKSTPDLMRCFETPQGKTSVLLAAMQAAAVGLEPNTPTQDAWLLPRRNQNVWECQLMIGYRGLLKLARRSGSISTIYAEVVHERDHFRWERGLERDVLEHRPYEGDDEPGELTHAYAVARYKDGGYSFMVLNRREVEQRRAMSDSWKNQKARPYSPWTRWPVAMWRKSVIRALVPYLDLSPDVDQAIARDEARLSFNDEDGVIEAAITAGGDRPALAPVPDEPAGHDEPIEATATTPGEAGEPGTDEPIEETGEVITQPQIRAVNALLAKKLDRSGNTRFPWLTEVLGRDIGSTTEITKAEASQLIDDLQNLDDYDQGEPDEDEPV